MRLSGFLVLASCIAGAGCAAAPTDKQSSESAGKGDDVPVIEDIVEADQEPEVVCVYETRTGTHRKERICYSKDETEAMSDKSKEALRTRGKRGTVYVPIHPQDPRRRKSGN